MPAAMIVAAVAGCAQDGPLAGVDVLRERLALALRREAGWRAAVNAPDRVLAYGAGGGVLDVDIAVRSRLAGRMRMVVACHAGDGDTAARAIAQAGAALMLGAQVAYVAGFAPGEAWPAEPLRTLFREREGATAVRLAAWVDAGETDGWPVPARMALRLVANTPVAGTADVLRVHVVQADAEGPRLGAGDD